MFSSSLQRWKSTGAPGFIWYGQLKQAEVPLLLSQLPSGGNGLRLEFFKGQFKVFRVTGDWGRELHFGPLCGVNLCAHLRGWLLQAPIRSVTLPGDKLEQVLDIELKSLWVEGYDVNELALAMRGGRLKVRRLRPWPDASRHLVPALESVACRVQRLEGRYELACERLVQVREFRRGLVHLLKGNNRLAWEDGDRAIMRRIVAYL